MNRIEFQVDAFYTPEALGLTGLSFEERRPLLLQASRELLEDGRRRIFENHRAGASGKQTVQDQTALTDLLLTTLFRGVAADLEGKYVGRCAVIAIGGYGRGDLNPRSDVDIMFFSGNGVKDFSDALSGRMLYLLWDLALDVGHSVRSVADCLEMVDKDITARTAILDSRLITGDATLYAEYENKVIDAALTKNTQAFIRQKIVENDRRLKKYGSTVYLLEPNIKEGEGGLRDLHCALWLAMVRFKVRSLNELVLKGVLTGQEGMSFAAAFEYLWRVRSELHYLSTRKNDQILFDQQEKIARFLGYKDTRKAPAVEQFMQDYYAHATVVEHIASGLISKVTQEMKKGSRIFRYLSRRILEDGYYLLRSELRVSRKDIYEKDPSLMMKAFVLSQRHGVNLSVELKGLIRDNLHRINDRVRRSRVMSDGFWEILRNPDGMAETLQDMHHLQFLNSFIPEFGRIYCKVQHDAYHIYTVDIHTLFAVEEIAKLWRGDYRQKKPLLTKVANDIEKRELLLLAVLLHDIGKGEGKDHCNKGADMIPTIARRLGLGKEDSQRLEFLVRNHLLMAHISQRRDLHDEKLILQFSRQMGMSENLKMLYLLTFADIKAVGPEVWSEWKGLLLNELYEKSYEVLERGDFRLEKRSEKVRNRKRKIRGLLEEEYGTKLVKDTLKAMSTRYILSFRSAEISEHLRILFSREDRTLVMKVDHEPEGEYTQVTISTVDIPGLFSKITGVMAANGMNILGAQIFTQSQGIALDILQVRSQTGEAVASEKKWRKIEEDLTAVIEGRVFVDDLVKKRHRPSFLVEKEKPKRPNRVEIDNEVSDQYTVVDIYANDKIGLLYNITKTLKDLGLYIGVSKISTKVDQVTDTFYVQDIFGQKVTQDGKVEEMRQALLECLDHD